MKKIIPCCLMLGLLFSNGGMAFALDRVVLNSVPAGRGVMRIYLLADKKTWMDYENFTIQVGEQGQDILYHFPDWYHGKYDSALYYVDISGDKQKDLVVVLNNDRAGLGKPVKDIHILNQKHDLLFEETQVKPILTSLKRLAKIEQHGPIVTIFTGQRKHRIDISKYPFINPRFPRFSAELTDYTIKNGRLIATVPATVTRDDSVQGGYLGLLKIDYGWDGKKFMGKSIKFFRIPAIPK